MKDQRSWNTTGLSINMRHALWIVHQFIPYKEAENGYTIISTKSIRKDDGWLLIIEREKKGRKEVAFFAAQKHNTAYGLAALAYLHKQMSWRDSKF